MDHARAQNTVFRLLPLWVLVQIGILSVLGVHYASDTGRYLAGADALLNGTALPGKSGSYLGYNMFVAVFRFSGLGPAAIVAGQILLAAVACVCMFHLGSKLGGARAGLLAAGLYAVYPDVQMWNFYVLTESIFISMLIISVFLLVNVRGPVGYALVVPVVVFTILVRPNGIILAAAVFAFAVFRMFQRRRYAMLLVLGLGAAVLALIAVSAVSDRLAHENIGNHLRTGTVIWGYEGLRFPMALADVPEVRSVGLGEFVGLIAADPVGFVKLAAARLAAFFVHARPYWSPLHNAFTLVTLAVIYALAWRGARQSGLQDLVVVALSLVAAQAAIVGATFADWDGRHLDAVLPMLFVLAAAALARVTRRFHEAGDSESRMPKAGCGRR
ncbi:MAG: hypothetical protein U5R46_18715 [Gammaproteobacteria bacterium]|nr:hypothetical protein [Gammaproteobacteria bacterium]